jgi:osmotically-inducible protein OsmY
MQRDLRNRAYGVVAETKSIFRRDEVTDNVLVDRVRSRLGRIPVHIGAFDISARDGVVTLRGQILADELSRVLRAARFVRGVKEIDNQFEVHERAANVPALQGQPQPLRAS